MKLISIESRRIKRRICWTLNQGGEENEDEEEELKEGSVES